MKYTDLELNLKKKTINSTIWGAFYTNKKQFLRFSTILNCKIVNYSFVTKKNEIKVFVSRTLYVSYNFSIYSTISSVLKPLF